MATPGTVPATTGALHVTVISPEKTIFDGEVESVVAPGVNGELGILRNHAPLMTVLGKGEMRIKRAGEEERFELDGGFLQVVDNVVTVLSEGARSAD